MVSQLDSLLVQKNIHFLNQNFLPENIKQLINWLSILPNKIGQGAFFVPEVS